MTPAVREHPGVWPSTQEVPDMPDRTCSVDGCERPMAKRGWCNKHYLRWIRHGSTDDRWTQISPDGHCVVDRCEQPAYCRGWCTVHYQRWRRLGSTDLPKAPFGSKWCHRCKSYLPLNEFYEGKGSKGRMSPCRTCRAKRDKTRRKLNPPRTRSSQNRKRRARMKAAKSEPYTAEEIADRDGWRCQICGRRIGRTLNFPHPRSLSIDHIIPIGRGGDDVKINVQAVHFRCNASKGPRGVDQLRLIG